MAMTSSESDRPSAARQGMQFVFDSATFNPFDGGDAKNDCSDNRKGLKRKRYTLNACQDCKRRKVKCTGEDPCHHCWARRVPCVYIPGAQPERALSDDGIAVAYNGEDQGSPSGHALVTTAGSEMSPAGDDSTPETKVEQLESRVRALERMMSHMAEFAKYPRYNDHLVDSPPAALQVPVAPPAADEETEGNMFAVRKSGPNDVSLSSQVAAMGAYLSRPTSPKPRTSGRHIPKSQMLVELPDPPTLQHLLDVYFRDFDCYFPFLQREDTESRIYTLIRRLGYSSYNRMLLVANQDLALIALTCVMLAMAECLDSEHGACDTDSRPGWPMYLQGFRAVQRFFFTKDIDLDVVRTQCLIAAYLMHSEILRAASHAISVVLQLANDIKLNDQRAWSTETPEDVVSRQLLWWTIFFLDRRIAQKASLPYHIRDTEFYVDDFKSISFNQQPDNSSVEPLPTSSEHKQHLSLQTVKDYVQVLINLARLWGHVWDTFFAIGVTRKTDWMEVEIMDTQILNARRQLPFGLTWDTDKMTDYALNGEPEPQLRRRLHLYTRLNLLRMLIRQNPLRQTAFDPETACLCARLSREIIHAHDAYLDRYPGARASGYFVTASMVECVYHLAPVLHYTKDANERNASVTALQAANGILIQLSSKLNVAKKALRALNGVMLRWASENSPGNTGQEGSHHNEEAPQHINLPDNTQQLNSNDTITGEEWINMPTAMLFGSEFDFATPPIASNYDSSLFSLGV